jgi:hypothetical protein
VTTIDKPWGRVVVDDSGLNPPANIIKNRRLFVVDEDFSLEPDTLVGSSFHAIEVDDGNYGEIVWQGTVVAEPMNGAYLLEFENCQTGAAKCQRLFTHAQIVEGPLPSTKDRESTDLEWRWYDSAEEMRVAYVEYTMVSAKDNARGL